MAGEVVGEAFVRIRPLTSPTGFAAEAEPAVASAGSRLGEVFAAAFAAVGVAELAKSVVTAALDQQASFAILERAVQNVGAANEVAGKSIETLLGQEARLKGFSEGDLAAAFTRLVSVTHDSAKAYTDLQHAEDLSRLSGQSLATTALAIARAEQGRATSLSRIGIIVPKVTTAEDALKKLHDEATGAGAKLDQQEKELYATRLAQAKAIDAQATSQEALAIIQQRAGGEAARYAATSAGQFDRLRQDISSFKVAIGTELLPVLTSGAEHLGAFLQKASQSPQVLHEASTAAHDVGVAFTVAKDVIGAVAPVLLKVSDAFGGVTHTIEILGGAFATIKTVQFLAGIGVAQTAAAASTVTATGALTALTAALEANTAALGVNDAAVAGSTTIYDAYGGVLATVAGEEAAAGGAALAAGGEIAGVGAAAGAATGLVGTLSAALAGLATLGPIIIPIGLAYFTTKYGAKNTLQAGIDPLGIGPSGGTLGVPISPDQTITVGGKQYPIGTSVAVNALRAAGYTGPLDTAAQQAAAARAVNGGSSLPITFGLHGAALAHGGGGGFGTQALPGGGATGGDTSIAAIKAVRDGADAAKNDPAAKTKLLDAGKNALTTMAQGITQAQNDLANALLSAQQNALTRQSDQITLWYDTESAKLLARGQQLTRQQSILSQESAQISLAQSRKSLSDLRQEVLLPGGRKLPASPEVSLHQLQQLERRDKSPALADYILQFRQANLSVQQGKLGVEQGALGLLQQRLDQQRQRETSALGLQQDTLKLAQDAQTTRNDQLTEAKAQTKLLHDIKAETAKEKFVTSLERNPGSATKRQKALAGVSR